MKPIISIKKIKYVLGDRQLFSIDELHINSSEVVHLIGDSGAGKSLFGLSLIGFYANQSAVNFKIDYEIDSPINWQTLRGTNVGYIFQQPKAYFNPTLTCGEQLMELFEEEVSRNDRKSIIINWCEELGLTIGERIFSNYPHEFSIGQLQRLYVISALIKSPELIIADEPFAHLDWPTAKVVATALSNYIKSNKAALLLISHERPGSLIQPDFIWKLDDGKISAESYKRSLSKQNSQINNWNTKPFANADDEIIHIENGCKSYGRLFGKRNEKVNDVLTDINFSINTGQRIGLMGTSGSGKSTLASILSGLNSLTSGQIIGAPQIKYSLRTWLKRNASHVQLVFQDPFTSFNTGQRVVDQIATKKNLSQVKELAFAMGLKEHDIMRNPMKLSGGELQRFALIRALTVDPSPVLLILDEALSALDPQTQSKVLDLLRTTYPDMSILFISHRYQRLEALCEEIYFLDKGRLIYHLKRSNSAQIELPNEVKGLIGEV